MFTDAIGTIIRGSYGQERNNRLLAVLSDDKEIVMTLKPVKKLASGTRVSLR